MDSTRRDNSINHTPTRPPVPRPSSTNEKIKLQQRIHLNHLNSPLSTASSSILSNSTVLPGSNANHHKKSFGIIESSVKEDDDDDDDNVLQFSSLKLQKYQSTLTVPGLNIFNSINNNNKDDINEKSTMTRRSNIDDINENELEFKSHIDIEDKVKTLYGIDDIAKSLALGEIEFCYIQQSQDDPYKFRMINKPKNMTTASYCTVSKNGIVRYTPKGCEYEDLNEFMGDVSIFNKLRELRVFKEYRLWKTMLVWKKGLKERKYMKYKESLLRKYFLLEDRFQTRIPYIMDRCDELKNIRMLNFDINSEVDIKDFLMIQEESINKAMKVKNKLLNAIVDYLTTQIADDNIKIIEKVTETLNQKTTHTYSNSSIRRTKRPKEKDIDTKSMNMSVDFFEPTASVTSNMQHSVSFFDSHTLDQSSMATNSLYANTTSNYEANSKYVPEVGLSYTDRANIRVSCRKLASFLRVTDFIIRDALYDAVRNNLQKLYEFMSSFRNNDSSRGSGLFAIKLMLIQENDNASYISSNSGSNHAVYFDIKPNVDYFMQLFQVCLYKSNMFGCHITSLITEHFSDSLAPIANEVEELHLLDIINDRSNIVSGYCNECLSLLGQDFNNLMARISKFQYLCSKYTEYCKYIKLTTPASLENMLVEEINGLLATTEEDLSEYSKMQSLYDIGLIRLDLSDIKNLMIQKAKEKLSLLHNIIPIIHNKIEDNFCTELYHLTTKLEMKPASLDEFIVLLEVFNETNKESDRLYAEFSRLTGFYDLFSEFKLPNNDAIMSKYISLSNLWYKYNDTVLEFENLLDARFKTYRLDLRKRVSIIMKPVEEGKAFLNNDLILTPESDPTLILPELQKFYDIMQNIRDESNIIEKYQILMQTSVFSISSIRDVIDAISSNFKLWTSVQVIKDVTTTLNSAFFREINIDKIFKDLQVVAYNLSIINENFNYIVRTSVVNSLHELTKIIPVLQMLQTDTLQERHIERLTDSFGKNIYASNNGRGDTVASLISGRIMDFSSLIDTLSAQSSFENNVESKMNEISSLCDAKEFDFELHAASNILCISNFVELKEFLEDNLYWIESCIQSKYAKPHLIELSILFTTLKGCIPSLESLRILQMGYIQLRIIFTNARTARHLSHAMRYFQIVDGVWRQVIGITRTNSRIMELFQNSEIFEKMTHAIDAVDEINKFMDQYLEEQCNQWPKLYIMDRSSLIDAITTNEPQQTFQKTKLLIPAVSELKLTLDKHGSFLAEGFISRGNETLNFLQPCSVRSSLADWMKGLESALRDRLKHDIFQFVDVKANPFDDMQKPTMSDQSRMVYFQTVFWNTVYQGLQSTSKNRSMKPLLQEISDQIFMCTNLNNSVSTTYQILSVANAITLLMYMREFVEKLLEDPDSEMPATGFLVENALKKRYSSNSSSITIQQGRFQIPYGFNYCGFGERLILTALTERCWHAMSIAFQNVNVPFVSSGTGQLKRVMVTALSKELGADSFITECSLVQNPESLFRAIRSSFASNLFMIFCDTEKLNLELQSILFTQLMTTFSAVSAGATQLNIGGQLTDIKATSNGQIPRISIIYNLSNKEFDPYLSATVRAIFRPIQLAPPSYQAMFKVLFTAYSFWDISKSALRLNALCDYIAVSKNIDNRSVANLAVSCIKTVGTMMLMKTVVLLNKQQLLRVAQEIIKNIVHNFQKHFTDDDLRYISNLFLENQFKPDLDRLKFRPQKMSPSDIIVDFIINNRSIDNEKRATSIVIVGAVGVGKSKVISSAIDKALSISPDNIKCHKNNGLNPFLMANMNTHPSIEIAASGAMNHVINQVEPLAATEIIHLDLHSSHELIGLSTSSESYAQNEHKSIRFIWECTELSNIDPFILSNTQIIHIKSRSFTLNNAIAHKRQSIWPSSTGILATTLEQCVETYLIPCLMNVPADTFLSTYSLADNVLLMFHDIYNATDVSSRINDNYSIVIAKIFIFACIWTIGVCSSTAQEHFDKWFKAHIKKVFPVIQRSGPLPIPLSFFQDGRSSFVHHYYLQIVQGEEVLDWVPCCKLQMSIDSTTSSDNDISKRLLMTKLPSHSYSHSYESNQSTLVVSTHTTEAVSFIQRCILKSKDSSSSVFLLGGPGTGKSSLVKLLYNDFIGSSTTKKTVKFSFKDTSNESSNFQRWLCLIYDSKHQDIYDYITVARKNISESIIEERWPDEGVIFIEDVNIRNDFEFLSSCAEWLRSLNQHKKVFDFTRQKWSNRRDIYSVCSADSHRLSLSDINERLIRHSYCVTLGDDDIQDVFSVKLLTSCPTLHEISEDISTISFKLFTKIKSSCKEFLNDSSTSIQEKMFAAVYLGQSVSSILENVFDILIKSLVSMAGFTNYDALRVYDRVVSDYFAFLPSAEEAVSKSLVSLYHSSQKYKFQGFSDRIKRELDMKEEACQKSEDTRDAVDLLQEDIDDLKVLDKYIAGFTKNGPTYYIGLVSPTYTRENFVQNFTTAIPTVISGPSIMREENLGFFMDVQRLASQVPGGHDISNPYTIVTGQEYNYIQQIIQTMTALHPLTFYHCTKIFTKAHIQRFIDEEVDNISDFLENCNFFLKNRVNMDLSPKSFLRKSGSVNSSRSSFMIASDEDTTLTSEAFFTRYPTMGRIWHVHICPTEETLEDGDWATLIDIIEVKNKLLISKLMQLGLPDMRKKESSRMLINYYMKKQFYFFTFASDRSIMAKTNHFLKNPSLIKKFRFFNLSPSSTYIRNYYKHLFSRSKYLLVENIIDDITKVVCKAIAHQSHHHSHHDSHLHDDHHHIDDSNEIIKLMLSKDFKMGSMHAIEFLYNTMKDYSGTNTKGWTHALMNLIRAISVGARQRYYVSLEKKANSSSNINSNDDIADEDNDDVLFYDAVFNVIFSRYVMLLNEERQNGVVQHLIKKFKTLSLPRTVDFDVLPLATVMLISQYQQLPYQSEVLDTVVGIARTLPEASSLRRLLSAIGIMLICNCKKGTQSSIVGRFIDRSNLFSVLLSDILNVTCIPQVSSPLHHGCTRVLDIKLKVEEEINNVHPMLLTASNMWMFTININSRCMFEFFIVNLMLQGYTMNPLLMNAFEKYDQVTLTDDSKASLLETDFTTEKIKYESFKLASSDFDLQWSSAWKDIEKIVLTINAVLHSITIFIRKRELPPEYQSVFLKNLKSNLDEAVGNHSNIKGALATAVSASIVLLKRCLSEHSGVSIDAFIFCKLILGWGDHNYIEIKKLLHGLCEHFDLGIKANIDGDLLTDSIFLTKGSQNIVTLFDSYISNTGKRHSIIGSANTPSNASSLRTITSEEHLHDLSLWIADFPNAEMKTDATFSLLERFIMGYVLKPLSLPQLLKQAINELGHVSNTNIDNSRLHSIDDVIIYNPSGYIDIRNSYRSITSFDVQCYMGVSSNANSNANTIRSGTQPILFSDDDVLISSNRDNDNNSLSNTMTILACMGRSINFDVISNYISSNKSILVETSQIMDHASDNMNSMTVINSPTCTNDSFLATLEHSLKVVRFMPVVIVNSTPTEKSITISKAIMEVNEEKEKNATITMNKKAIRIRWLLAIFHSLFSSRLHLGVDMLLGDDTLVCAVKEVDRYLSLLLSASLSISTTTTISLLSGINNELCIEYIINTLYLSLIHDSQQQNITETLFRSIFCAGCLDMSIPYFFQDNCLIPDTLDDDSVSIVLDFVKQTMSERLQLHQVLGCTQGEISSLVSNNIYDSMNNVLASYSETDNTNKFVLTNLPIPVLMSRIKDTIASFESMLPSVIMLDSDEMVMAIDRQSTANRLSRMDEKNKKNSSKKAALHIKGDILEFDPIFAFVLAECTAYNNFIEDIIRQCKDVLNTDVLSFERLMFIIDLVLVMETGMIPSAWILSSSTTSPITVKSWISDLNQRKSFLTAWALSGIPNFVPFHLLANPTSLIHALKESYAIKIESSPDRIYLTYRWLTIENANKVVETVHNQNLGCSIIISPLTLMNATLNESRQHLTPLQSYNRDSRGQDVALLISANVDFIMEGSILECPLYIAPTIDRHTKFWCPSKIDNEKFNPSPILLIPIEIDDKTILVGPKLVIGSQG